jgi:hypothetical protein
MKKSLITAVVLAFNLAAVLMAQGTLFEGNKRGVLYLGGTAPVIDGQFEEWQGLEGSSPQTSVYGPELDPADASARFVLWTDNKKLYVFAEVSDDRPNENDFPPPIAWRNDSVELYIGANTVEHSKFQKDDSQIRIVPRSKGDTSAFGLSVNDHELPGGLSGAVVYSPTGYRMEVAIPLNFLMIKKFELGQAIRLEFQLNDADNTERDRLIHWSSPKDNTYYDPSAWGNGVVQALPDRS